MRYSTDKRVNEVVAKALRSGWTIKHGKHLKLFSPGGQMVPIPRTPSDHRSFENIRHYLRRISVSENLEYLS